MKIISKKTLNNILMTGFFEKRKLQEIKFEKECYLKEGNNIQSHDFSMYISKVSEPSSLYRIVAEISSPAEGFYEKQFDIGDVKKYNQFCYKDNHTFENKVIDIPTPHPTIEEIWKNPVVSSFFHDFVIAYNSSLEKPIDVNQIYSNRLFHPTGNFEKLLYSDF